MAWQTPKTNWASTDGVAVGDMNRIEGNEQFLKDQIDNNVIRTDYTKSFILERRTNDPTSPEPGRLWFRSDL